MLCAAPALRALRAAHPSTRITLIGLPWSCQLASRFPNYIDEVIVFPGHPDMPECVPRLERVPGFLREVHERHFDLALQLHGSGRITNAIVALFGAHSRAGFHEPQTRPPVDGTFIPWPATGYEAQRLLALTDAMGLERRGDWLEFPVRDEDVAELHTLARNGGWELEPAEYVCIHPGARRAIKQWAPERFAAVADVLADRGLAVVLTGTSSEAAVTRAVASAMRNRAIQAAGPMSIGALAALLRGARFVLCNDSGVSHLAAALRVPSVVAFLVGDLDRWAPLDVERHRVLYDPDRCTARLRESREVGRPCANRIMPADMLREIELLPGAEHAHAA